jgi:hypothetical protein
MRRKEGRRRDAQPEWEREENAFQIGIVSQKISDCTHALIAPWFVSGRGFSCAVETTSIMGL